jgi:uncharacterized membrane protein YgcG
VLIAVYDGEDQEDAVMKIGAAETVVVEGESMNLRDLVAEVTQFTTEEELHENSVLFFDPENVDGIREWVVNEGTFLGASGERLSRMIKTKILARVVHSHFSERMVGLGNGVQRKFGQHEREDRFSAKVKAVANGTRLDARLAAYEFEQEERNTVNAETASVPEVHWRDAITGFARKRRGVHMRRRNKQVLKLEWKHFQKRAARLTPDVVKAAASAARQEKKDGTDHAGRVEQRKAEAVAGAEKKQLKRQTTESMRQYSDESMAAGAQACDPPRLDLGMIDLRKPPSKEVLALECELRSLAVKRSGAQTAKPNEPTELVQFLVQRLRDYHDGDNVITKLTSFEAGKKAKSWVGDSARGTGSSSSTSSSHGSSGGGGGASSLSARPPPRSLPPLPARGAAAEEASSSTSSIRRLQLPPIGSAAAAGGAGGRSSRSRK